MSLGDVVDEFLDQHGLANTGTAEQTNLSTTGVGGEEVENLYTGLQDLGGGRLLNEGGRVGVGRTKFDTLDGTRSSWQELGSNHCYGLYRGSRPWPEGCRHWRSY